MSNQVTYPTSAAIMILLSYFYDTKQKSADYTCGQDIDEDTLLEFDLDTLDEPYFKPDGNPQFDATDWVMVKGPIPEWLMTIITDSDVLFLKNDQDDILVHDSEFLRDTFV
jgi:hypothetical protein